MTIASSNFVSLAYQKENKTDGYGNVPTTGNFKLIPFAGESLQFTKESIKSNNINSSRQVSDVIQTGFNVSGGIDVELAPLVFDEFIEGAMWNAWDKDSAHIDEDIASATFAGADNSITASSGTPFENVRAGQFIQIIGPSEAANKGILQVLRKDSDTKITITDAYSLADESAASTVKGSMIRNPADGASAEKFSYFFEKTMTELDPLQRFSYAGCMVNSMSFNAQSSSILSGSFDFMGAGSEAYTGNSRSVGAVANPIVSSILNAVSHIKGIRIDGVLADTANTYFQSLDFSVNNSLRGVQAVGNVGNVDVSPGQLEVSGSMNTYFANDDMYTKFLNGTEFSLSYEVTELNVASNTLVGYVFSFPRATVSSSSMSASGNNQDMVENMQRSALMAPSDHALAPLTSVQIDRFCLDYTKCADQV